MQFTLIVESDYDSDHTAQLCALALQDGLIQNGQDQKINVVKVEGPTTLKMFQRAVGDLSKLMHQYRSAGATDTEPLYHMRKFMVGLTRGKKIIPKTVRAWELYSGAGAAAAALSAQCVRISDLYFAADENMSAIRTWIKNNYSW